MVDQTPLWLYQVSPKYQISFLHSFLFIYMHLITIILYCCYFLYSDSIPLFGYQRRSYLFLSGLLGALSWSLMATIVDDKYSAAHSIVLGSLAVAVSDVVSQKTHA
jgi:hypothetical protein